MPSADAIGMDVVAACREYAASRSRDASLTRWLLGSLAALALAAAAAPARRAPSTAPPRRPRRSPAPPPPQQLSDSLRDHSPSSLQRFRFLLRIAVPSAQSQESGTLIIITLLLLLRTLVSLRLSVVSGRLGKLVVQCDMHKMLRGLAVFLLWCIPAAVANSSLSYCIGMLQLQVQANLTQYFHHKYLNNAVFFRLASSPDVLDIDQRITKDIEMWSFCVTGIYTSLFKALVDVAIFSRRIAAVSGARVPVGIAAYYTAFALLSHRISPNMEAIVNEQMELAGAFVNAHQRLMPYAEEIVLSQGQRFHQRLMDRHLASIIQHRERATYASSLYGLVESFCVKYGSAVVGYAVCGAAVFSSRAKGLSATDLSGVFVETTYLFKNLAEAVGQLLRGVRSLFVLRGLTHRVYELQEGVEQALAETFRDTGGATAARRASLNGSPTTLINGIERGEHIEFDRVPLVLPTGEVLCEELSFFVRPGMNLLVVGPNGCGKSSTVRLLGGLWPLRGGRMVRPRNDQIYYVPQRPYLSMGTLRDQITYPLKSADLSVSESTLLGCLEMAMLDDIFLKPNVSWNTCLAWAGDTLSMGEKQKLAMARLFFHRPRFAILDECSSMMDIEVEEQLYSTCRHLGISLITIAHRISVWRHHNWILKFDGCGNYLFSPLVFDERGDVVLTKVTCASDPAMIGQEVRFNMSQDSE